MDDEDEANKAQHSTQRITAKTNDMEDGGGAFLQRNVIW